uniref:Uncharacterized protein n=1 Tax=Leptocylindrus danicus TaxID=163516 RepID=A0A7S2LBK0_9STRA|mmetsp:Transcript_34056/g.49371  ORF Transcript_34056/g.49371 Transcript_34056/m.49371 type:complete len:763 (+) Transcript_34056:527-2815(+)|eukprot:CAMPEP_0116018094 /NCGR_PEP_ID=MMETSP0321-20121206/8440_1 /TAXON_ID=163516 /ORGANISM="Leptocylindrus danicus var. danicus, Strain B650" /LENGTH=762 /DNA_ID=CAMNT_0003488415 /DNA_START=511 /DNA_END=2799 /DNA_ORIENTATION=-
MSGALEKATVIYRDTNARNIVFRDQLRRQAKQEKELSSRSSQQRASRSPSPVGSSNDFDNDDDSPKCSPSGTLTPSSPVASNRISNDSSPGSSPGSSEIRDRFIVEPLPPLDLGASDVFHPLLNSSNDPSSLTESEKRVLSLLTHQKAVVKTIRHSDVKEFLQRFKPPHDTNDDGVNDLNPNESSSSSSSALEGDDKAKAFRTSTSLLPPFGKKMRAYGSVGEFNTGIVFALPEYTSDDAEDEAVVQSGTWVWPSGYSAKTEFNIDDRGNLINGRHEAQVSLSVLRSHNSSYVNDTDYIVGGRMIKGGLNVIPYNEVYVRVGGNKVDPSYEAGVGTFIALFCRSASYKDIVSLLRTRARIFVELGKANLPNMPLLLITPEAGAKVFHAELQEQFWKIMARHLSPFQNVRLQHKTLIGSKNKVHLEQKMDELLDLNDMRSKLTDEECASIAGGFGATDDSVAQLLIEALHDDKIGDSTNKLQRIVNEGLVSAVRAADYHTSRQLLILYSLVASKEARGFDGKKKICDCSKLQRSIHGENILQVEQKMEQQAKAFPDTPLNSPTEPSFLMSQIDRKLPLIESLPRPPPPPLDTDRLRYATNSDGLLAVLGAAEVLKSIQNGSVQSRIEESVTAIEEWVLNGEQSVTFRLSSWRDQRAAQGDLKIAFEESSAFTAFIGTKALSNRKMFAGQLRRTISTTDFNSVSFLQKIHEIVTHMHSPCLRLELLQYILGLDNRYSVAHVARSVELAATCLNISMYNDESDLL